jgi:hypothetical protein
MEPEPFVIMGMMLGSGLTIAIQAILRRRKAKKEQLTQGNDEQRMILNLQERMHASMLRLEERISVVERISTENEGSTGQLSKEIEKLRL